MVLDDEDALCKTPHVETAEPVRECPEADDGYVVVSENGSHSCAKTVPAHCTDGKVLRSGECWAEGTERAAARWRCDEGTLEVDSIGGVTAYSCRIALSPPECPSGESYRVSPSAGCYAQEPVLRYRDHDWECERGELEVNAGDFGVSRTCKVTLSPPECPPGETYRTAPSTGCYERETYYRTRGYTWTCSEGTRVTESGEHGISYSCRVALSPPECPPGETYRSVSGGGCYERETYYRTRGYDWTCSEGTRVTESGEHGISYSCRITLSPPRCPAGETYRTSPSGAGCYEGETYYRSRPYRYSCPSGFTMRTYSDGSRNCKKTETYQEEVCAYDPFAGNQCWYETRTRTLTRAVIRTCPSGYSPDGTGCTADSPSTRWTKTDNDPTRYRYEPAQSSCRSGYSPAGTVCQADTASTRWAETDNDPTRHRYEPAESSCPSGWSDNGIQCESDTASTRWSRTPSSPVAVLYETPDGPCPSGWADNGARCEQDTGRTRWSRTASAPVESRTEPAQTACDAGYSWNAATGFCEKPSFSDPTAPATTIVGDPPEVTCPDSYTLNSSGGCERTVLGDPTAVPEGAGCNTALGTLQAGPVAASGTLGAGCVSLRRGDAQNPHYASRFTLRVAEASAASLTASSSQADVYLYVLTGAGTTVTVVASDDDSGGGTDAHIADVTLQPGVTYTIEVTTSAAAATGAFALAGTVTAAREPVAISGLADAAGHGAPDATATVSDAFTVDPSDAACAAAADTAGITPTVTAGTAGQRTVSVSAAVPFSHAVTVSCTASGRSAASQTVTLSAQPAIGALTVEAGTACTPSPGGTAVDYECTVARGDTLEVTAAARSPLDSLTLAWAAAGGATVGTPADTAAAPAPGGGYQRTSTVAVSCTADGTLTVTATADSSTETITADVECAEPPDPCDTPLGVLPEGTVSRSGSIEAGQCRTTRRWWGGHQVSYARYHTFTLTGPATVGIDLRDDAANDPPLNTYVLLTETHDPHTGKVVARHGTWSGPNHSRISGQHLDPGDYTIIATTVWVKKTGSYNLTINTAYDPKVTISGLDGAIRVGTGLVWDRFTVAPAGASCSSSRGAVEVGDDGQRALSVSLAELGDAEVAVTCTHPGHDTATAVSTLTALVPVSDVTVEATAGGDCVRVTGPPGPGVDAAYTCTMTRGLQMRVAAVASGRSSQMTLGWTAGAGAAVAAQRGGLDASVVGDAVVFARSGTAEVDCTADADIVLATAVGGTAQHTTRIGIVCVPPVAISAYTGGEREGPGTITGSFDVSPATAACTAANAGGIAGRPTVAGSSTARTVRVPAASTGWVDVEVECTDAGYATSTATARFTARDEPACTTDLGTMWHGSISRTGTLTAASCTSHHRTAPLATFRANRYTFTMATAGWVTIDLEPTETGQNALDTYLLLLNGHGSGGTVRASDNNLYGDATELDDIHLTAGNYTIEATTALSNTTGSYRLRVQSDYSARSDELPATVTATVGVTTKHRFDYQPHDAYVTATTAEPEQLAVTVTALHGSAVTDITPKKAGNTQVTVTFNASNHTSSQTITVQANCPPRHIQTETRTCTPLATTLPTGCAVEALHDGFVWGNFAHQLYAEAYGDDAESECVSLTQNDKAAYFVFEIQASLTGQIWLSSPRVGGAPFYPLTEAGAPSMTLWRETGSHPATGTLLDFVAMSHSTSGRDPFLELSLVAGRYIVELAPTVETHTNAPVRLHSVLPLGRDFYDDVKLVGNVGLEGGGMTLGQFLDARGSTAFVHHPDPTLRTDENNTHDPLSLSYPWLAFWTDRCSIPRFFSAIQLEDYPDFGGQQVPFIYACMRHDFNWRNLYRAEYYYNHIGSDSRGPWRIGTFHESNGLLGKDLVRLCNVEGTVEKPDPESPLFTWDLRRPGPNPNTVIRVCEHAARKIKFGVGLVILIFNSWSYDAK